MVLKISEENLSKQPEPLGFLDSVGNAFSGALDSSAKWIAENPTKFKIISAVAAVVVGAVTSGVGALIAGGVMAAAEYAIENAAAKRVEEIKARDFNKGDSSNDQEELPLSKQKELSKQRATQNETQSPAEFAEVDKYGFANLDPLPHQGDKKFTELHPHHERVEGFVNQHPPHHQENQAFIKQHPPHHQENQAFIKQHPPHHQEGKKFTELHPHHEKGDFLTNQNPSRHDLKDAEDSNAIGR